MSLARARTNRSLQKGTTSAAEAALGNYVSAEETARLSTVLEGLREMQVSLTGEWEELMLQLEEA